MSTAAPSPPAARRAPRSPCAPLSPARFCLPQAVALAGSLPPSPGKAHCAEAGAGAGRRRGAPAGPVGQGTRTDAAASAAGLEGALETQPRTIPSRELRNREVAPSTRSHSQCVWRLEPKVSKSSAVSHAFRPGWGTPRAASPGRGGRGQVGAKGACLSEVWGPASGTLPAAPGGGLWRGWRKDQVLRPSALSTFAP